CLTLCSDAEFSIRYSRSCIRMIRPPPGPTLLSYTTLFRSLNALLRGLPGTAPVSLFCHSYGSVLCGLAADELPDRVADIAVAGSPGMRVDNAGELRTPARVWAMRDADDWVQDVPHLEIGGLGHGADPVSSRFGARVLS